MIKIQLLKNGLTVEGHSEYDEHGRDIVCSAISAIVVGSLNVFDDRDIKVVMESGYLSLEIKKWKEEYRMIMKVVEVQLRTIQQTYGEYVSIKGGKQDV